MDLGGSMSSCFQGPRPQDHTGFTHGGGVESNWFLALLATFLSSLECGVF